MEPARRLATYADLAAAADDRICEIIAGELSRQPPARPRHARAQRILGSAVGGPFDDGGGKEGPGGWWILPEVDIELGPHDIVRPDLSGWPRSGLPDPDVQPITIVPDWVCEVLSPSSLARDRVVKRRLYALHGVAHYWLVDPDACIIEALSLRDGAWVDAGAFDGAGTAGIPPFDAIEFDVGRLFLPRREG